FSYDGCVDGDGVKVFSWIERFTPYSFNGSSFVPDVNAKPVDVPMVGRWSNSGSGVLYSPVYELKDPNENGYKRIVTNTFSATFDLCPSGSYELTYTFFNTSGQEISQLREVVQV